MEESEFPDLQKKPEVTGFWHKDPQFPGCHKGSSGNSPGESSLRTGLDWLSVVAKETTLKRLVAQTTYFSMFLWIGWALLPVLPGLNMRLWLFAGSASVWVWKLGWLGFSLQVVFCARLPASWWTQGSKKASSRAQACYLPASCLLMSHWTKSVTWSAFSVNAGEAHTRLSVPMHLMQWVSYCCPLAHTLDFALL